MLRSTVKFLVMVLMLTVSTPVAADVESMLQDWATDFRSDPMAATPVTFGVRVKDAQKSEWHFVVSGERRADESWSVALRAGFPETPAAYFVTDEATLRKLHSGELASLTAMGKAFSTDFAPLDFDFMDGFEPTGEAVNHLIRLSFHFWTRGFPEKVRFGDLAHTRSMHGADGTLFYYQQGFRSGWFSISKGQHVNADEASRTNPFPSLFVITRGRVMSRIGGVEAELKEGEAIYVGPGVSHEFWNDWDKPGEGVILMFGDGA